MAKRETVSMGEGLIERRQRLREKVNPALEKKLDWILDWQADENCHSLMQRWKLGQQVDEIGNDIEKNVGKTYGLGAMKVLEEFLHEDKSLLTDARRFYRTYPDEKRVQEICDMTMQDQCTHISYSHMRQLISIKDEQKRAEALNLTLENCWTSVQLGAHVQVVNGGKHSNSPNGRAGIPKNAEAVIAQQLAFADDFDNRNARVWGHEKYSVGAQVDKLDPTEYTEDLAKKLGEVAVRMRQLADAANARADEAEARYEKVSRALAAGTDNVKMAAEMIHDLANSDDDDGDEHLPSSPRANRSVGRRAKTAA